MHYHDRIQLAKTLGISFDDFDRFLLSANFAYETIRKLGPFYGKSDSHDPNFRITAEPVYFPISMQKALEALGNDILMLARALPHLPQKYQNFLGKELDYKVPITWRIDAILDEQKNLLINEIQGTDGATALMVAEQLAYNLRGLHESTIAYIIKALYAIFPDKPVVKLAWVGKDRVSNFTADVKQTVSLFHGLSYGKVKIDLLSESDITDSKRVRWDLYDGIFNTSLLSPNELQALGVPDSKILSMGDFNAIANKGVFALVFEPRLLSFWHKYIGAASLKRLQKSFIPSKFLTTETDFNNIRVSKNVAKITWLGGQLTEIENSKGVALPEGDIRQSSEEQWNFLKSLLTKKNAHIIGQKYIKPAKIVSYLRKKGTNLERVEWYNRVCVKYVCEGDPRRKPLPKVAMTAVEVTLGPDIIPTGRACAFTAGAFDDVKSRTIFPKQIVLADTATKEEIPNN